MVKKKMEKKERRGLKEEKCEKKRGLDQKDKGEAGVREGKHHVFLKMKQNTK